MVKSRAAKSEIAKVQASAELAAQPAKTLDEYRAGAKKHAPLKTTQELTVEFEPLTGKSREAIVSKVVQDDADIVASERYQAVRSWDAGRWISHGLAEAQANAKGGATVTQECYYKENFTAIGRTRWFEYLAIFRTFENPTDLIGLSGRQIKTVIKYVKDGADLQTALGYLKDDRAKEQLRIRRQQKQESKNKSNDYRKVAEESSDLARKLASHARKHLSDAAWIDVVKLENVVHDAVNDAKRACRKADVEGTDKASQAYPSGENPSGWAW